jgi:hypothetical protein
VIRTSAVNPASCCWTINHCRRCFNLAMVGALVRSRRREAVMRKSRIWQRSAGDQTHIAPRRFCQYEIFVQYSRLRRRMHHKTTTRGRRARSLSLLWVSGLAIYSLSPIGTPSSPMVFQERLLLLPSERELLQFADLADRSLRFCPKVCSRWSRTFSREEPPCC